MEVQEQDKKYCGTCKHHHDFESLCLLHKTQAYEFYVACSDYNPIKDKDSGFDSAFRRVFRKYYSTGKS